MRRIKRTLLVGALAVGRVRGSIFGCGAIIRRRGDGEEVQQSRQSDAPAAQESTLLIARVGVVAGGHGDGEGEADGIAIGIGGRIGVGGGWRGRGAGCRRGCAWPR